jgi:DNA-directed RNA polymerase specialized sigma subunit
MTAKELLEKIIRIRKAIDYQMTKIEALVTQAENTSCRLTGMPHNPSPDTSPMATAICKKIDLENEIEKLKEERNGYIAKIDLLEDDDLKRLLVLRYAQEAQWEDIAAELGFCERHIYRLHKVAVAEFEKKLKDVM